MCGILGGRWGRDKACSRQTVEDSLRAMAYRGPDGSGILIESVGSSEVCLAHNRLAILDLTESALQPMHSDDNGLSIVFNGEIYNYVELREELRGYGFRFSTDSDTEVLLCAWRHWGQACLEKLTGMFAFAVLDRRSSKLTCVRDAFGVKPLFYKCVGEEFIFASEIGALRKLSSQSDSLNVQRAYDYLVHGDYDSAGQTFFTDIHSLKPGHLLSLNLRDGMVSEPQLWWRPSIIERPLVNFSDAADELRELFLKSVRLHMRSDVPIAAALSGGIDSSAIVCAMRYVAPDQSISSFSYIAEGHSSSEEQWVDLVNSHVGAIPYKIIANAQELLRDLPDMISAQGEPFGSSSIYAQYRVCQYANSNGFKVLLEGQGADEILGGYIGYPGQRVRSLLEKGDYARAWEFFNSWAQWPDRSRWAAIQRIVAEVAPDFLYDKLRNLNGMHNNPDWIRGGVLSEMGVHCRYPRVRRTGDAKGRRLMAELATSLSERGLSALLRHGDRNSMRFSVESRVPFLTLDLVNFSLGLPEDYLVSNLGETKSIFRAAMRGIVPSTILDRKDKVGFATPEQSWLNDIVGDVRNLICEDLALPFFDQKKAVEEFDKIISSKKAFSWQAWRWINFIIWYRQAGV